MLTAKPDTNPSPAQEIIVSHEATLLALAAFCDQLDCLPHKAHAGLPDYLDGLKKLRSSQPDDQDIQFFLDLHKARVDMQNRAILPDADKWHAARSTTLQHVANLCHQLKIPSDELESVEQLPVHSSSNTSPGLATPESSSRTTPGAPATSGGEPAPEVRRYPRFDCTGAIELTGPHSGRPRKGQLLNLSIGGCFAHTDWPLDVGTRVEIRLELTGVCFRALGEVRMVDSRGGMGIEFAAMSARGRQRLAELITELGEATERPAAGPRPQQAENPKPTP
ncbi:MAG TPA: PilZ domain-containing protein [Terriglobales bacterium]|nr:PilZ domain-containing protein [Terriglobales bacterium]